MRTPLCGLVSNCNQRMSVSLPVPTGVQRCSHLLATYRFESINHQRPHSIQLQHRVVQLVQLGRQQCALQQRHPPLVAALKTSKSISSPDSPVSGVFGPLQPPHPFPLASPTCHGMPLARRPPTAALSQAHSRCAADPPVSRPPLTAAATASLSDTVPGHLGRPLIRERRWKVPELSSSLHVSREENSGQFRLYSKLNLAATKIGGMAT